MNAPSSTAWTWRHAFAQSTLPPTTKHVLHTLGMFMNELGEGCYPSVADICRYSGLDKKTVLKHLGVARDGGWIAISQRGYRGQRWKRQEYVARWPERDLVAPCPPDFDAEGGGAVPPPSDQQYVPECASEAADISENGVIERESREINCRSTALPRAGSAHAAKTGVDAAKMPVSEPEGGGAVPPPSGVKAVELVPEGGGIEGSKVVEQLHQDKTSPITPPYTSPSGGAQKRAREDGIKDRKKIETAYWRLIRSWPKLTGQPKDDALKAFFNLTPEERAEAERKFPVWLEVLKAQGRDHTYHPKTYFGKKLFADVPEPKPADSTDGRSVEPPFGPGWMAERFLKLLAGPTVQPKLTRAEEMMVQQGRYTVEQLLAPKRVQSGFPSVNLMDEFAGRGKGSVAPALAVELKPLMEAVKPDFPIFEQWRELHEANGWPWIPDPGSQPVVFFPKGGPQGLEAFKAVIAGEGGEHDGGRCEAAE